MFDIIKKHSCLLFGMLGFFLSVISTVFLAQPTQAYYFETPASGGTDICSAPAYKVMKHFYITDDGLQAAGINEDSREGYFSYITSTRNSLCFYTGGDHKVWDDTITWQGGSYAPDQNDLILLHGPEVYSNTEIRALRTIDCTWGEGCADEAWAPNTYHWWFTGSYAWDHNNVLKGPHGNGKDAREFTDWLWGDISGWVTSVKGTGSNANRRDASQAIQYSNGNDSFKNALSQWSDFEIKNYLVVDWQYTFVDLHDNNPQPDATPLPNTNNSITGQNTCEGNAGTSLGWILCPTLKIMGDVSQWVYDEIFKPALIIDPQLLNTSGGTYSGWEIMRNFANVALVIFLLIVIFSQLTSVGIDNYGIKKALPKIIIAAILINLSYFICQGLVDVSNIVGSSIQNLLFSLGQQSIQIQPPAGLAQGWAATAGNIFGIFIGAAAGIGAVVVAGGIKGILLALVVAGLGIVIGAFFLFGLLAVRQALVVLLVVIAPIAFACYMLPNTKTLFDKWRKTLQAMLLLYPIMGLLVGAGDLTSRILLGTQSGNWFIIFLAMLLPILPIFALPFVLKSAMQSLGTLGAKLSGLTSKGRVVSGKVKGTDLYQNARTRAKTNFNAKHLNNKSLAGKIASSGPWGIMGQRAINSAQAAAQKQQAADVEAYRASIQNDPEMASLTSVVGAWEELQDRNKWSTKDALRAEALQQEMLSRPGGASTFNSMIKTKNARGIGMKHLTETAAFLGNDAKGFAKSYEKGSLVSRFLQDYSNQAPHGAVETAAHTDAQENGFEGWANGTTTQTGQRRGQEIINGQSDAEILRNSAGDIRYNLTNEYLTSEKVDSIRQSRNYRDAAYSDQREAIENWVNSRNRINNSGGVGNTPYGPAQPR